MIKRDYSISLKTDGFCRHARPSWPRFADNAQSERQNISSRVNIARNIETACLTTVPPLTQYFCDNHPATTTNLARAGWVHPHYRPTSVLSFVDQFCEKTTPTDISNRLRQHTTSQSLYIQLLDRDQPISLNQSMRCFVMEIGALMLNMAVCQLQKFQRFLTTIRTHHASIQATMTLSHPSLSPTDKTWILNSATVTERREHRKTNVDSDALKVIRQKLGGANNGNHDKPFTNLPFYRYRLYAAPDRTVPFYFDFSNALQIEPSIRTDQATVPVLWKRDRPISIAFLKSWVASLLLGFHAFKKPYKRGVGAVKYILTRPIVSYSNITGSTDRFKLLGLSVVIKRRAVQFPCITSLLKGCVIKTTRLINLTMQRSVLRLSRIKTITESTPNLSQSVSFLPFHEWLFRDTRSYSRLAKTPTSTAGGWPQWSTVRSLILSLTPTYITASCGISQVWNGCRT